ncbi:hypothetical protein LTR50_001681 [Elasticomyces elasticus]|nr:hypothetical protein LTR50_001681 [Elasticomyces elasticus]
MDQNSLKEFTDPEYWNTRYSKNDAAAESYNWLCDFSTIKPFLTKHLPPATMRPKILQLGCGNSTLTKELYDLNYHGQISIDFSSVVINNMRMKHADMDWRVMDVRHTEFDAESIDVAIDRATLDALLYGSLWDPEDEVRANVKAYVDEVARILKPGGKWLYITWRQPHFLRPLLQRPDIWDLEVESLADQPGGGGMFEYFGFLMVKHVQAEEKQLAGV